MKMPTAVTMPAAIEDADCDEDAETAHASHAAKGLFGYFKQLIAERLKCLLSSNGCQQKLHFLLDASDGACMETLLILVPQ